jgi:hypothetical protein
MKIKISIIILFFLLTSTAFANCIYNGNEYPEGTVIGPYVCVNGQWKNK